MSAVLADLIPRNEAYYVEQCCENWARWMRGIEVPQGLPDQACVGENYTSHSVDSEAAYEKLDAWLAETTNAAIEGLQVSERVAIYGRYLHAVFRFNRKVTPLEMAMLNLADSLRRRGVWLGA